MISEDGDAHRSIIDDFIRSFIGSIPANKRVGVHRLSEGRFGGIG